MMSQKHLHELLREDQEPFHLNNYIADCRSKLRSTTTPTPTPAAAGLKLVKRKPVTRNFCINHACLFTSQESPDVRKSPFTNFQSPATKSPSNSRNPKSAAVFLHVPPNTSSMLLDAAMRIQKRSSTKNVGLGFFGSFLKRLKQKSTRTKRREINCINGKLNGKMGVNDVVYGLNVNESGYDQRCRLSGNNSRISSEDWSEKSSESETSCSSISVHESYEIERENQDLSSCDKCFCSSPSSPFRFSLLISPSPGRRTPDFLSPATSPSRRFRQEKENYDADHSQETHVEDEEQFSPVSVLDPPFVDDEHDDGVAERDNYDLDRIYASVQRTKHQLLQKLSRFEKLVELDPIVLEKHMAEQYDDEEDDEDDDLVVNEEEKEEPAREKFLKDIPNHLGIEKIPPHIRRLVLDLIAEENKIEEHEEREVVVERVCKRLDSWTTVRSNTIDMMVEFELRREKSEGWKRCDEEKVREIGMNVGIAILEFLMEELVEELVISFGHF